MKILDWLGAARRENADITSDALRMGSRPMAGGTLFDRIIAEVASIRREIENG